jgi:hypothetical protein
VASGCGEKLREWKQTSGGWASKQSGPERKKGGRDKRKRFTILKRKQTNEFKYKFEFKHSKTMHEHVCNH